VRQYVDNEILPHAFEWESAGKVPDAARDLDLYLSSRSNIICLGL